MILRCRLLLTCCTGREQRDTRCFAARICEQSTCVQFLYFAYLSCVLYCLPKQTFVAHVPLLSLETVLRALSITNWEHSVGKNGQARATLMIQVVCSKNGATHVLRSAWLVYNSVTFRRSRVLGIFRSNCVAWLSNIASVCRHRRMDFSGRAVHGIGGVLRAHTDGAQQLCCHCITGCLIFRRKSSSIRRAMVARALERNTSWFFVLAAPVSALLLAPRRVRTPR